MYKARKIYAGPNDGLFEDNNFAYFLRNGLNAHRIELSGLIHSKDLWHVQDHGIVLTYDRGMDIVGSAHNIFVTVMTTGDEEKISEFEKLVREESKKYATTRRLAK